MKNRKFNSTSNHLFIIYFEKCRYLFETFFIHLHKTVHVYLKKRKKTRWKVLKVAKGGAKIEVMNVGWEVIFRRKKMNWFKFFTSFINNPATTFRSYESNAMSWVNSMTKEQIMLIREAVENRGVQIVLEREHLMPCIIVIPKVTVPVNGRITLMYLNPINGQFISREFMPAPPLPPPPPPAPEVIDLLDTTTDDDDDDWSNDTMNDNNNVKFAIMYMYELK